MWTLKLGDVGYDFKGSYVQSQTYTKNQIVNLNNSLYVANRDVSAGEDPTTATSKWDLWVSKDLKGNANTLPFFLPNGNLGELDLNEGQLVFNNVNGLHFAPSPNTSFVPFEVQYMNSGIGSVGDTIIGNDGALYTAGYKDTNTFHLSSSTSHSLHYTKIYCDENVKFVKVFSYRYTLFAIDENYALWAMGYNIVGNLGLDVTTFGTKVSRLTKVPNVSNVVDVTVNGYSSTNSSVHIIERNGGVDTLKGAGYNYQGRLGLGNTTTVKDGFAVVDTSMMSGQLKLHRGSYNFYGSTFVTDSNTTDNLFGCGYNVHGNLGLGNKISVSTFTAVPNSGVVTMAHSIQSYSSYCRSVIVSNGRIGVTGYESYSQGGLGANTNIFKFTTKSNYIKALGIDAYAGSTFGIDTNGELDQVGFSGYYINLDGVNANLTTFTKKPHPIQGKIVDFNVNDSYDQHVLAVLTNEKELWKFGSVTNSLGGSSNKNDFLVAKDVTDFAIIGFSSNNSLSFKRGNKDYMALGFGGQYGLGVGSIGNAIEPTKKSFIR